MEMELQKLPPVGHYLLKMQLHYFCDNDFEYSLGFILNSSSRCG